jgi:hypothetical protein
MLWLIRPVIGALLLVPLLGVPFATAGTASGEVVFQLTLEGPVHPDDGFFLDVRCDGGDFCEGGEPRSVFFCGEVADSEICEVRTYEFRVAMPPQTIEYHLNRVPEVAMSGSEPVVVLSRMQEVSEGRQTFSLTYVYPGGAPAPALPDTRVTGTDTGHVVFRVTLQGPVPQTDTFYLQCRSTTGEEVCFESDQGRSDRRALCQQASESPFPLCEARTYQRGVRPPVGEQIEYALLKWTDGVGPVVVLSGSLIVDEARQDISLSFVYSDGSAAPTLPNTAMAAP